MTTTTDAVTLRALTKRYRDRTVVDNLTLRIPRGVVAGFVGPNGAGKTTAMAMLLGLVRPCGGSGTVLGHPISRPDRYLHRVGALIESPGFYPGLSGERNLRVVATIGGHRTARVPELLDLVGLTDRAGHPFRQYSLGMKQRLGIAAALLGDPELVILDEPTNGLDPAGIAEIRQLITAIAGQGRTVLVSSHLLGELEQTCDWLLIVDRGRLLYHGPFPGFAARTGELVLHPEHQGDLDRLTELLTREGHPAQRRDGTLVVPLDEARRPRDTAAGLNRLAHRHGIVLAELHIRQSTLEEHFLALVGAGR